METMNQIDFGKLAEQYSQFANGQLGSIAEQLGVSVESLERLGCGIDNKDRLVFPMRNAHRKIIGIRIRLTEQKTLPDGRVLRYLMVKGGQNGLFLPDDLETGTLFICEGCTDTAAVLSLGLAAIGRPSCADGVELVRGFCQAAGITAAVVVGDNDEPGRIGAEKLASALVDVVSDVRIIYPADMFKDIREELRSVNPC
jgi:hypothetical protein